MNILTLASAPGDTVDVRVKVVIDGEEKFQVALECLEECFLTRDPIAGLSYIGDSLLRSSHERIISYGFCHEGCCPSTVAEIHYSPTSVRWSGIRLSTGDPDDALEYIFEREAYDREVSRCVAGMACHLLGLYNSFAIPMTRRQSES